MSDDEKDKGGRPSGAKNKPKTVAELIKQLETAAEKEGKKFAYTIDDGVIIAADDEAQKAIAAEARRKGFGDLNIELAEDEIDTYKCGNCGAELAEAAPVCPQCGEKLNW